MNASTQFRSLPTAEEAEITAQRKDSFLRSKGWGTARPAGRVVIMTLIGEAALDDPLPGWYHDVKTARENGGAQ